METYVYRRVSSLDQIEGTSLNEQSRKCLATAVIGDLVVTRTFTDAGISGATPLCERPAGADMLATVQPGDTIIAYKIDRLFRNSADALSTVEEWKKLGIQLIIADFGADPVTENGTSKLLFGILSMVAEFERDILRQRVSEGRAAKKAAGGHIGGSAPFGYRKLGKGRDAILEAIPAEQEAIKSMVAMQERGMTLREISAALKADGHQLSHVSVGKVLKRQEAQLCS
ncbi:recombinase family protein [Pseudoruegeria sp. HB172150]|uniref:recombinase family protein n=1 Tax=Pseudoruegeria sp. HB172150 TaxID=2721164 RepID=UPI0015576A9E|nr:recombinase family protein [Pseudoruegeria sp. HB172150]